MSKTDRNARVPIKQPARVNTAVFWFVYESDDRAIAKCWREEDAIRIADALNAADFDAPAKKTKRRGRK